MRFINATDNCPISWVMKIFFFCFQKQFSSSSSNKSLDLFVQKRKYDFVRKNVLSHYERGNLNWVEYIHVFFCMHVFFFSSFYRFGIITKYWLNLWLDISFFLSFNLVKRWNLNFVIHL